MLEARRGKPAETLLRQHFPIAAIILPSNDCRIQRAAIESIEQTSRRLDLHFDQQSRIMGVQPGQQHGQFRTGHLVGNAEGESTRWRNEPGDRAFMCRQEFARHFKKGSAARGKPHQPRRPLDQLFAKPLLQALQFHADCGLGRIEGLSRAREALKIRDQHECLNDVHIEYFHGAHTHLLSLIYPYIGFRYLKVTFTLRVLVTQFLSRNGFQTMTNWHYATLTETADAIRRRVVSPLELTNALLDRIATLDPALHAYATVTPELALAQARRAEAEIARGRHRGPLHGIPIALKDIYDTEGIVTAAGMPIHAGRKPETDATVVKRLAEAGAVLLGKLQLTEGVFAKHHPTIIPPRNPWNGDYYAGASSSGSGVATAAGLCFATLGSDTGGSIRFPSSANGVTGLKPSWGRVSRHGVFPLADSLDHVGPMTRSAADAGVVLGAIAGLDPDDPTSLAAPVPDYLASLERGVRGLRIGIDHAYNETNVDNEIVRALQQAAEVFEELGATIVPVRLPDHRAVNEAWGSYCGVEAALAHAATYPARSADYGPAASGTIAGLIEYGRTITSAQLMMAHHARLAFSGALATLFADVDLLLIPTQPLADFTVAQEAELFTMPNELTAFLRFVSPFNMSGSPTITLPGGFTAKGLPLSFQLVGRHLDEALLVRAGDAYQQVTDWHRRHPSL
jgi:amidase